jgi:iron uptake system component EfeO
MSRMSRRRTEPDRGVIVRRRLSAISLAAALALLAGACGDDDDAPAADGDTKQATTRIDVTLSDKGCDPEEISTAAGPTTFHVENDGSAAVTEFEVLQGDRILGEVENVIPGVDRTFTLTLEAGQYVSYCPGGDDFERGTITVTGTAATSAGATGSPAGAQAGAQAGEQEREQAVANYLDYVKGEADQLRTTVGDLAAAVKAGDIARSKALFAATREHYETIEPIAESFGDLDPAIDAREGDVPDAEWTGFHKIEQALWVTGSLDAMGTVADKLVADVAALRTQIDTVSLEPAQIANGAVELLNEVSTSKITGEEDRYSHTDLSDFAANVDGSQAAFDAVRALLAAQNA